MWGKSQIHFLHTIVRSPSKMRKITLCQLQRMYNIQITDPQTYQHFKSKSQKPSYLHTTPSVTKNPEHGTPPWYHQYLATEDPTKLRSYVNVTEGLQSFKPNPTPINNNGIALLKLLDAFKSILYHFIFLLATVLSAITKIATS